MTPTEALSEAKKLEKSGKAGEVISALAKGLEGAMEVVDATGRVCQCDFCHMAKNGIRPDQNLPESEENTYFCDEQWRLIRALAKFDQIMKGGE